MSSVTASGDLVVDRPVAGRPAFPPLRRSEDAGRALHSERIITTDRLGDFADLWPRSNQLGDARAHVFQCADILEVWLDTIGTARGTSPCFVAVLGPDGRPQMLLPLGIERRSGARILTFLDGSVSDYNAPVLFPAAGRWDADTFRGLWCRILAALPAFDVAMLEKMPTFVQDIANPLMHLPTVQHPASGHRISLSGTWQDFEAKRLPRREDGRRKFRKLSALGTVTFDVADTPAKVEAYFDAMITYKTRKFVSTRVPGFEMPGKLDYFREATRRLVQSGPVHLSALRVGDEVVASHWGLMANGHFYHMMPGYADGGWERCSPGRHLNDWLIRQSFEQGLQVFDFGIGDESYKHEYCDLKVSLRDLVAGRTFAGRLYVRSQAAVAWLRQTRWWQALRPFKWMLLRAWRR